MLALFVAAIAVTTSGCGKNAESDPTSADGSLYALLKNNNFAYYKGENVILSPKGSSPHGPFKLRFNAKAMAALDSTGKLPAGSIFPDSSIVLKEVYDGDKLKQLVPMMKSSGANSASGWVWAQYGDDGKIIYSVSKEGEKCVSCHQANGNRDLTLSFDLH